MKRSILLLMVFAAAIVFFGCEKEKISTPDLGMDNSDTAALKAAKVKKQFEGTCKDLVPGYDDPGNTKELPDGKTHVTDVIDDWYDESTTEPLVTGVSRWTGNYYWEGAPFVSPAKVFGNTIIFVGGDSESNEGVWEMKWHGTLTLTPEGPGPFAVICYGNGVGKSGIVKGMTGKWTYTLVWGPTGPFYETEGYIK